MRKIDKLIGAPTDVEVNGIPFKIYPLKVKDMEIFNKQNPTQDEQVDMSKELIVRSLPDEDLTKEDVEKMNMDSFMELVDKINEVNGFKEDDRVGKIKEKIAQQQKGKE